MTPPRIPTPIRGIVPPLVTPLVEQDQIDVSGTERLVNHVIAGGVQGVFVLGTTGEGTSLSPSTRHQYVELVCEIVEGRVPVFVGITDTCLRSAIELANLSFGAGASVVVSAAPYYLPLTQSDLLLYTDQLATELPLPLMLYNMPSCTKTAFDIATVRELSGHRNIIGMKDTSGDLDYYQQLVKIAQGDETFTVLIGPEELLARSVALGGHGGVTGGANMFPSLYVALYEAAAEGDEQRAQSIQQVVQQISDSMYRVSDCGARVIHGIKVGLSELGICSGVVAPPFRDYNDRERARISAAISEIEPLLEIWCRAREVVD